MQLTELRREAAAARDQAVTAIASRDHLWEAHRLCKNESACVDERQPRAVTELLTDLTLRVSQQDFPAEHFEKATTLPPAFLATSDRQRDAEPPSLSLSSVKSDTGMLDDAQAPAASSAAPAMQTGQAAAEKFDPTTSAAPAAVDLSLAPGTALEPAPVISLADPASWSPQTSETRVDGLAADSTAVSMSMLLAASAAHADEDTGNARPDQRGDRFNEVVAALRPTTEASKSMVRVIAEAACALCW